MSLSPEPPEPPPSAPPAAEQRFYNLVQQLHAVVWELDPSTLRTLLINDYIEMLLGYPVDQWLAEPNFWVEHLHPDDRERTIAAQEEAIRAGRRFELEYRMVAADGHVVWLREMVQVERDEHDRPSRLLGVMLDISPRKQAEAARLQSDERVRAIFEGAAIGIALVGLDGRILQGNPALQRMLGFPAERLAGVHFAEVTHPDDLAASSELFFKLAAGERDSYQVEKRHIRADGGVLWTRTTCALTRDAAGKPWLAIITVEDISERKRQEEERVLLQKREHQAWGAAERRARQEAVLRAAAEAISEHFTVAAVVQQIAQSALSATNADGAFVERVDILHGELEVMAEAGELTPGLGARIPYSGSLAEEVIRSGEPELITRVASARNQFPDGFADRCPECCVLLVPLSDAGEAVGALVLLRKPERWGFRPDEVDRARIFSKLASLAFGKAHLLENSERRRVELERVMASRVRLMRGFTHDVKNPLGAANGYLELLELELQGALTDKQRVSVQRAHRALDTALRLIDDLLEFARAESGRLEIQHQPTDVREIAREVVEEYRLQAEGKSLTLELEPDDGTPVIDSDVSRVRQILGNLISNAIRHTPGPGSVEVRVSARDDTPRGRWVAIEVSDTGPGIPPEMHERIFAEFFRLAADAKPGAGLGLAISRQVAHALGGDLTVQSEVGKGATFTLLLPIRPESPAASA